MPHLKSTIQQSFNEKLKLPFLELTSKETNQFTKNTTQYHRLHLPFTFFNKYEHRLNRKAWFETCIKYFWVWTNFAVLILQYSLFQKTYKKVLVLLVLFLKKSILLYRGINSIPLFKSHKTKIVLWKKNVL